jgi:micrococcal nuclease
VLRWWTRHGHTYRTALRTAPYLALAISLLGCGSAQRAADVAVVTGHVDGDTVIVDIGGATERVRLLGIDTPELFANDGPECGATQAAEFTARSAPIGSSVELHRDVVPRDHYGRLLAVVTPIGLDQSLNASLLRHGWAQRLVIPPNGEHDAVLTRAEREARSDRRGIWSLCVGAAER